MLNIQLIKARLITGPLTKNTSHSALESIKKWLLCQAQFSGGEAFLGFGLALHERHLVQSFKRKTTPDDERKLKPMLRNLEAHPIVRALKVRGIFEKKFYERLPNGVELAVILDCRQPHAKSGYDLKTTVCKSLEDFVDSAIKYGYFRQGLTYKICARLNTFFFVGICKTAPFGVFVFNINDYPEEIEYAKQELEFLTYFYKHYGKPNL